MIKLKEKLLYLRDMESRFPIKEDNPYKWNRWLGFVQGALWMADLIFVGELKQMTKTGLDYAKKEMYRFLKERIKNNK